MTDADRPQRRRRGLAIAGGVAGGAIALALATAWVERMRIARDIVDARLTSAGVPARYRITAIDPFAQTIADVRIGAPAHPDLTARQLTVRWRYTLAGPVLAGVDADGARLRGQWRDGRLRLGALDRLIPAAKGGGAGLPDLALRLADVRARLLTPAGAVTARIDGRGNPTRSFAGTVALDTAALAVGGCAIERGAARLAVATRGGGPHVRGPVTIGAATCPAARLHVGMGGLTIDARLARDLASAQGTVAAKGFAGTAGAMGFGGFAGSWRGAVDKGGARGAIDLALQAPAARQGAADRVRATGRIAIGGSATTFDGRLTAQGMRGRAALADAIAATMRGAAATPLAPLAESTGSSLSALFARSDAAADVALRSDAGIEARVDRATIRAANGVTARLGGVWRRNAGEWEARGQVAGDGLPGIAANARGKADVFDATMRVAPYRAGSATLALTPLRIDGTAARTRFATIATMTGPIAGGRVTGLAVPIDGSVGRDGTLRIGEGCRRIAWRRVALSGMTLAPGTVPVCGAPIVLRGPGGAPRIDAHMRSLMLSGRSGTAPLTLAAARIDLAASTLAADGVALTLGSGGPSRLDIGHLTAAIGRGPVGGTFADAAGTIGAVPLALSGGSGRWALDRGTLTLAGAITVADRDASPRFLPLASDDVRLTLADGHIRADADLAAHGRRIARATLHHDLARGTGAADIAVPGIVFARRGLQPEMLTPLTLGVVANVAGTVAGAGHIAWSPAGVTSTGSFHSDRLDLAAAFGPVEGLAGTIRFTDLLGLVTAPHQTLTIATINPGVAVTGGVAHYRLPGGTRIAVEDARWPFAGGTLELAPTLLDFGREAERRMTFHIRGLDAAAFLQQLDLPNVAATGTFDGTLPMLFDQRGGRIAGGLLASRGPGTLAYVGELSQAQLGTMGSLAFDALKAIRYSRLAIDLDGRLDGEMVSRVRFDGVRQAVGDRGLAARMIRNLPFRFNITIRAPFRGLVGSARSYADPSLLLQAPATTVVQPASSAPVR